MKKIILIASLIFTAFAVRAAVTNENSRVTATANGSARAFTFTFPVQATSHVHVFVNDVEQTSGFAVSLNSSQSTNPGGTVTFTTAPVSGRTVRIDRTLPLKQETVWGAASPFSSKTMGDTADRTVMQIQQLHRKVGDEHTAWVAGDASNVAALAAEAQARLSADASLRDLIAHSGGGGGGTVGDYSSVLAAGTTTARTLRERFAERVNILDFGADPTGATSSDSAFIAAMNQAFSSSDPKINKEIYLPAGTYLLTTPNILNAWTSATTYRNSVTISGDGSISTKIVYRPITAGETWMYDGITVTNRRFQALTVRSLAISLDATSSGSTVNLMRQNGNGGNPDQAFTFDMTRLDADANHPGILLGIEGTSNGSENKFLYSRGYYWKSVISSTNPQAVNQYVIGCDWELTKGPVYYFASGGGQLTVIGGSYILSPTVDGSPGSILKLEPGLEGDTATYTFIGIRTETYDPNAILYYLIGQNNSASVTVIGAQHRVMNVGDQVLARVNSFSAIQLLFQSSDLSSNNTYRNKFVFENSTAVPAYYFSTNQAGLIEVYRSKLLDGFADDVSWLTYAEGGMFRSRSCRSFRSVTVSSPAIALDVDMVGPLGWKQSRSSNALPPKAMTLYVSYWPSPDFPANASVILPAGSIVKAIRVKKVATPGCSLCTSATYQLTVTNGDGSYTYGSSTTATRQEEHTIMLENVNRLLASGTNQTLKLGYTSGHDGGDVNQDMIPGDMFVIEYY